MKPEFTDAENFLIAFYKDQSQSSTSRVLVWSLGYLVGAVLLVGVAMVSGDPLWGLIGVGVLVVNHVRELRGQLRYAPIFRSIIVKYDEALKSAVESGAGEK